MKKSYIKCPYCQDEVSVSGSSMHVRNKHTDKYEEFKSKFDELKKTAIIKESSTKAPVSPKEPPKIEDTQEDNNKHKQGTITIPEKPPEHKQTQDTDVRGDNSPDKGRSFLREFDTWCDSSEF